MEEDMKSLSFVNFDRFYERGWDVEVFGWIDKGDSYKDFVSLRYTYDTTQSKKTRQKTWILDWSTSSAKYTKEINVIINGESDDHSDCIRVEEHFNIKNVIRI